MEQGREYVTLYPEGRIWYRDGKRHRLDGPAVEWANGGREWWKDGMLHREGGEPALVHVNPPSREWRVNGQPHRMDGPAIIRPGYKGWFHHGKYLHSEGARVHRSQPPRPQH